MTPEQAKEDAFSALSRLEWLLLHAKPADFARIDMEREVPMAVEQVARVLRVTTQAAAMVTDILVAKERDRCAKIADGALMTDAFIGPLYGAGHNGACKHIAAAIRSGK